MKTWENPWKSMKNLWKPETYENLWKIYENLLKSMKNLWKPGKPMKIYEKSMKTWDLWKSMKDLWEPETYENLWKIWYEKSMGKPYENSWSSLNIGSIGLRADPGHAHVRLFHTCKNPRPPC